MARALSRCPLSLTPYPLPLTPLPCRYLPPYTERVGDRRRATQTTMADSGRTRQSFPSRQYSHGAAREAGLESTQALESGRTFRFVLGRDLVPQPIDMNTDDRPRDPFATRVLFAGHALPLSLRALLAHLDGLDGNPLPVERSFVVADGGQIRVDRPRPTTCSGTSGSSSRGTRRPARIRTSWSARPRTSTRRARFSRSCHGTTISVRFSSTIGAMTPGSGPAARGMRWRRTRAATGRSTATSTARST